MYDVNCYYCENRECICRNCRKGEELCSKEDEIFPNLCTREDGDITLCSQFKSDTVLKQMRLHMAIFIEDILYNLPSDKEVFILHGCNCFHRMKSGIAKYLSDEFPIIASEDKKTPYGSRSKLGEVYPIIVDDGLTIVNCYTQYKYGRYERHASYDAIDSALRQVRDIVSKKIENGKTIEVRSPMIGCGLGGGDWKVVEALFLKYLPFAKIYKKN